MKKETTTPTTALAVAHGVAGPGKSEIKESALITELFNDSLQNNVFSARCHDTGDT